MSGSDMEGRGPGTGSTGNTSTSGSDKSVRISMRVSPEVKAALERIQHLAKLNSITDVVRRSIGDELFLQEQMADDWKVLLQKDNTYREVVWPKF
jgi:hypothetical protein